MEGPGSHSPFTMIGTYGAKVKDEYVTGDLVFVLWPEAPLTPSFAIFEHFNEMDPDGTRTARVRVSDSLCSRTVDEGDMAKAGFFEGDKVFCVNDSHRIGELVKVQTNIVTVNFLENGECSQETFDQNNMRPCILKGGAKVNATYEAVYEILPADVVPEILKRGGFRILDAFGCLRPRNKSGDVDVSYLLKFAHFDFVVRYFTARFRLIVYG